MALVLAMRSYASRCPCWSLSFFTCSMCAQLLSDSRTIARQAPLSMGFSRQEYWSGLPCPPPGGLPHPGMEPRSPALQADSSPSEPPATLPGLTRESAISCRSARQLRHWGLAGCGLGCLGLVSLSCPSRLAWAGTPGEGFPAKPERPSPMAQAPPSLCHVCFSLTGCGGLNNAP